MPSFPACCAFQIIVVTGMPLQLDFKTQTFDGEISATRCSSEAGTG